jgi:hypothetical protein
MEIKTYIDRNEDIKPIMLSPRLHILIVFLRSVVPYNEGILGQLLEETFRCRAVDIEIQRLHGREQRAQGQQRNY